MAKEQTYRERVEEVRAENRALAVEQAAARQRERERERDDNGSHCCGAPVEAAKVHEGGRVTLWRCSQCGLPQDPR
jgi:hypothetical protein